MCLGELAQALGLKKTSQFSPPPSTGTGTSSTSINTDHTAMSTTRRPLLSATTSSQQQQGEDEGLPKAFVASLRVLFDILDEDKDGFVPFAEIKERWQSDEGPSGLPANVIECLGKVAPKNGKLSFERFCSGLRFALANRGHSPERGPPNRNDRQPKPTTATVRPNVVHPMRSFKSAPQLQDEKKRRSLSENDGKKKNVNDNKLAVSRPGKKPPRYSTGNYEMYYTRPVANGVNGDLTSSDTSYEDHKIYDKQRHHGLADIRKEKNYERRKEKIYEDHKEKRYAEHKEELYEDHRGKRYESHKERTFEDQEKNYKSGKEKIYEDREKIDKGRSKVMFYKDNEEQLTTRKEKINEQRNEQNYNNTDRREKGGKQNDGIYKDRDEIVQEDRNSKLYEEHRARLNGIRLRVKNRKSPKGDDKEKEEDPGSGPTRKDVPPNPYSHTDYMDYADLYHSPISPGKDKESRSRTMSPVAASSRTLSPTARPTSPTRPVSPTPRTVTSSSRPLSPVVKSMSPASRQVSSSPVSQTSDKERRRRSASRERKGGRQLQFESPAENGHVEKKEPQPERARPRGKSPDRKQVYNTNHNSNHVSTNHPGGGGGGGGLRVSDPSVSMATSNKRIQRRPRDDTRRHTSNGISVDYNLLKRMKQLEQERDVLIQGLEAVERTRTWYQHQLADVKEKQRGVHTGQYTHGEDPNSQSQQDRMAFQTLRIMEVNRQLAALVESSENGFPDHINLAMQGRHSIYLPVDTPISAQLRGQNRLLTKEVSSKSDRITQLEQEKASLIRQLFDQRGKSQHERDVGGPTETSIFL